MREPVGLRGEAADGPAWMTAFDGGEWAWYVIGHDPGELAVVDDPADLDFERLWMRSVPASHADGYGISIDDPTDTVRRDSTGRFVPRLIWVECPETASGAVAYMGARPKRRG